MCYPGTCPKITVTYLLFNNKIQRLHSHLTGINPRPNEDTHKIFLLVFKFKHKEDSKIGNQPKEHFGEKCFGLSDSTVETGTGRKKGSFSHLLKIKLLVCDWLTLSFNLILGPVIFKLSCFYVASIEESCRSLSQ